MASPVPVCFLGRGEVAGLQEFAGKIVVTPKSSHVETSEELAAAWLQASNYGVGATGKVVVGEGGDCGEVSPLISGIGCAASAT